MKRVMDSLSKNPRKPRPKIPVWFIGNTPYVVFKGQIHRIEKDY